MTNPSEPAELAYPDWAIDPELAADKAARFIASTVRAAGAEGVIVGLSGGIDSAVSAALAVKALGAEQVLGVLMPYATSNPASLVDARAVADCLGIVAEEHPITPIVDAWAARAGTDDDLRRGNVMARARMIVLYDISAREGRLVLGTGNRSEGLLGYTTLFGDSACALNPIGQLYKTEVRLLARHLRLPEAVIAKPPSADLWQGQTDEDELGFSYDEADELLHHLVDENLGRTQLSQLGFDPAVIERVRERVWTMAFKRLLPPVAQFAGRPDPTRDEA